MQLISITTWIPGASAMITPFSAKKWLFSRKLILKAFSSAQYFIVSPFFYKVAEVRINSKGMAQTKTTASGQRVPNFGFVVFEEEKSVTECLNFKPIFLPDGHRLNVETKKNKPPMVRSSSYTFSSGVIFIAMGDHGFDLLILFFDAWRPRCTLGFRFELTIL
jgi:hypothetical protein